MRLTIFFVVAATVALPAMAASKTKPVEPKDYSEVCHPAGEPGHILCETSESFAYCKALQGKGKMLVEGDAPDKPTAVVQCQQAG